MAHFSREYWKKEKPVDLKTGTNNTCYSEMRIWRNERKMLQSYNIMVECSYNRKLMVIEFIVYKVVLNYNTYVWIGQMVLDGERDRNKTGFFFNVRNIFG